jgi:glucosamine kinase
MSKSPGTVLIGVDGGGSGCRAAVISLTGGCERAEERLCTDALTGLGKAGPANVTSDFDGAIAHVGQAIRQAAAAVGVTPEQLRGGVAHIGLAGAGSAVLAARAADAFEFGRCVVTDDRPTTVSGALGGADGFVMSLGTGTIVARMRAGTETHAGGWGLNLSDHGSGGWIGRRLLQSVLFCVDGLQPHSDLTLGTLHQFGDDPWAIVDFAAKATPADYAALAPKVIAAAKAGDVNACVLMRAGALCLEQALEALKFRAGDSLCLIGGIGPFYRPFLAERFLHKTVAPAGSALGGALRLAAREAGKLIEVTL